jgi:hypothetical protein
MEAVPQSAFCMALSQGVRHMTVNRIRLKG